MFRIHLLAFGLACVAGCAEQPAKTQTKWTPVPANTEELVEVRQIEATGREIYRQDQLAWHASDALAAATVQAGMQRTHAGWVITHAQDVELVAFIAEEGTSLRHVADVFMSDGTAPRVDLQPSRALSDTERAMFRARQTALRRANNVCNGSFNTAILPAADGAWDVFVLTASSNVHVVPLGGHSRVRVSSDGSTVIAIEPYSKSCMTMDDGGPGTITLMVTHLVSNLPAPTHVFLSLTYPKPIMLVTKTHLWRVADGSIVAVGN